MPIGYTFQQFDFKLVNMHREQPVLTNLLDSSILYSLLDAFGDLCFVLTRDGNIVAANREARRVLGQDDQDLAGVPFTSFLEPTTHDIFSNTLKYSVAEGKRHQCTLRLLLAS